MREYKIKTIHGNIDIEYKTALDISCCLIGDKGNMVRYHSENENQTHHSSIFFPDKDVIYDFGNKRKEKS